RAARTCAARSAPVRVRSLRRGAWLFRVAADSRSAGAAIQMDAAEVCGETIETRSLPMSIQAVAWVLAQSGEDLPGTARLVLIALANHADHTSGHCWPSIETIAKEAGCGDRTASRYLGALRRNGFIEVRQTQRKNGKFRSNDYWIVFERKPAPWQYYD